MILTDVGIRLCTCFYPGGMNLGGQFFAFVGVHLSGSAMRKTDRVGTSSCKHFGPEQKGVFSRGQSMGMTWVAGKGSLPRLQVDL